MSVPEPGPGAAASDAWDRWLERLPKVELHLHLEGAIPAPALWELMQKYGGDAAVPDRAALAERLRYRDFPHFIDTWVWKNRFLREYDDFAFFAEAVARELAAQHHQYVEAFYSPPDFHRHGLETGRLSEALRAGLDRVPEVRVALIADLVRDFGPVRADRTLSEVAEAAHEGRLGIIGIGIGGSEHAHPPEPFAPIYKRARGLGLHTTAHAGEAAGAASIWGAVRQLAVERLGHATRAHEDPRLVEHLRETRVPLELCPISNVRTGVVADVAHHPVRRYVDLGLNVTINTDDPAMFGTSLALELRALHDELGFTADEIRGLLLAAVHASWLSPAEKTELETRMKHDPGWRDPGLRRSG